VTRREQRVTPLELFFDLVSVYASTYQQDGTRDQRFHSVVGADVPPSAFRILPVVTQPYALELEPIAALSMT
jgi:hypothetical protein